MNTIQSTAAAITIVASLTACASAPLTYTPDNPRPAPNPWNAYEQVDSITGKTTNWVTRSQGYASVLVECSLDKPIVIGFATGSQRYMNGAVQWRVDDTVIERTDGVGMPGSVLMSEEGAAELLTAMLEGDELRFRLAGVSPGVRSDDAFIELTRFADTMADQCAGHPGYVALVQGAG